jgi:hypothetical protein
MYWCINVLICHCISVLIHQCIKGSLGNTYCLINVSHAQLQEIEMIMHDTSWNIGDQNKKQ